MFTAVCWRYAVQMNESREHIDDIRDQFTRQADAYVRMAQTTNDRGLRRLVSLASATAKQRALDVACGPGFLTMAFAGTCGSVVGLDATDEFLTRARDEAARRGLENIRFQKGDAGHLPFDDASFDIVSCRAAFHHFPGPARVLAEMKRVAVPGGRVLIADMLASDEPAKAKYHNRVERLCDPTHVCALSAAEFEALFAELGLEILEQPRSTLDYELDDWISHGGPSAEEAREIHELMGASIENDLSGLNVRREAGRLHFSHTAVAYVLQARS